MTQVVLVPIIKETPPVVAWTLTWPGGKTRNSFSYFITWSDDTYSVASGVGLLKMTATWNYTGFAFPSLAAYQSNGSPIPDAQLNAASPRAANWAYPDGYDSSGRVGGGGAHSPEAFTWSGIPQSVLDTYAGAYLMVGGMVGNPLQFILSHS